MKQTELNNMLLSACNNFEIFDIQEALSLGADPNAIVDDSLILLDFILSSEKDDKNQVINILKLLISMGADINKHTEDDVTPLYAAACYKKDYELTKFLLENGADPNIFLRLNPETTVLLDDINNFMIRGANNKVETINNRRLIDLLISYGAKDCYYLEETELLLYNKKEQNLIKAIRNFDIEEIEIAIQEGADVKKIDALYDTISYSEYHFKGKHNDHQEEIIEILDIFINNGANINATDEYIPLATASEECLEKVVKYLIDKGAKVNINTRKDINNVISCPLYILCLTRKQNLSNKEKFEETLSLLLEAGAKMYKEGYIPKNYEPEYICTTSSSFARAIRNFQ